MAKPLTTAQLTAKLAALQAQMDSELEAKVALEARITELEQALATTEAKARTTQQVPTTVRTTDAGNSFVQRGRKLHCVGFACNDGHGSQQMVDRHHQWVASRKAS